jgi:hypothetical protein
MDYGKPSPFELWRRENLNNTAVSKEILELIAKAFEGGQLSEREACAEELGCDPGMTLRDYFAAKAMQGMLANPVEGNDGMISKRLALWSYEIADAMLEAREK